MKKKINVYLVFQQQPVSNRTIFKVDGIDLELSSGDCNAYLLFAGWEVHLPAGRQHFQALSHSFSPCGPILAGK